MSANQLSIESVRARYRLPATAPGDHRRQQRRLDTLISDGAARISQLLDGSELASDEVVCIRRLESAFTVRAQQSDPTLVETIGQTLAAAVRAALQEGGPNVVRYRSRRHALTDFVQAAAREDMARAWAYHQLGWTTSPDSTGSVESALRALATDPPAILPVLLHVAETGALEPLLQRSRAHLWTELARLALRAAGIELMTARTPRAEPSALLSEVPEPVRVALERSVFLPLAIPRGVATEPRDLDDAKSHALAVFTTLELHHTVGRSVGSFEHVFELVRRVRSKRTMERRLTPADAKPVSVPERPSPEPIRAAATHEQSISAEPAAAAKSELALPRPQEGVTAFAGLLLLVHLLMRHETYAELERDVRLANHVLRANLYQLGLLLSGAPAGDAALLAFAGLAPESKPPEHGAVWSEVERSALAEYAAQILARLAENVVEEGLEPDELCAWVVNRPARIVCDPGWIDVRLPLDHVATALRRAGLDLHPNWIPALGVVMRFSYE